MLMYTSHHRQQHAVKLIKKPRPYAAIMGSNWPASLDHSERGWQAEYRLTQLIPLNVGLVQSANRQRV